MDLGYHVFVLSTQSPNIEQTRPILYATVLVLLVLTFALNIVAIVIRARRPAQNCVRSALNILWLKFPCPESAVAEANPNSSPRRAVHRDRDRSRCFTARARR